MPDPDPPRPTTGPADGAAAREGAGLTHLDERGRARMVDVGEKAASRREATAEAVVRMRPRTAALVAAGDAPKGDVASVARIAGIQAAKRTWELVPLCHQVHLASVGVEVEVDVEEGVVRLTAVARAADRTGVEMEALMAVSVASLTVYDMVKGVERGVVVERVRLLAKSGGREDWESSDDPPSGRGRGGPSDDARSRRG